MAHEELRKTYRPGQRWETRIVMTRSGPVADPIWVPIAYNITPSWDEHQEYRRVDEPQKAVCQTCGQTLP